MDRRIAWGRWVAATIAVALTACGSEHRGRGGASAPGRSEAGAGAGAAGSAGPADAGPRPGAEAGAGAATAREIVSRECGAMPLSDEVPIVAGLWCTGAIPGPSACRSGIECLGPWDCEPQPFARCLGLTGQRCVYANGATGAAPAAACESDEDCDPTAGGRCTLAITHSTCQYAAQCERDADCGDGARCACGLSGDLVCVEARCRDDADCEPGERCRRAYACGYPVGGFFCTRAGDECRSDEDCANGYCDFIADPGPGAWRCSNAAPCTIP